MKFLDIHCIFVPKGGGTLAIYVLLDELHVKNIRALWANVSAVSMYFYMSIQNFEYQRLTTLHCGKSGRWYRSGSCNWQFFSSVAIACRVMLNAYSGCLYRC